ncbi:phosphoadenylyl-sulfate reductase [Demequina sp. SYSU T00039]|uniref:Adenosine 5'-phosphosulfate reductase n=1 Tax=Demequina lignilytica TaxID=3051663 RepID=A0AAW7M9M8_9MICO|nr:MULTISPECIES: phosphoadenylyl-sulfate reductase [unclassified Demequina]MDN4478049.1 phosphoadenylyl-sulfate reductase [Demequina sp. SYSU T00039-1]MDN4488501.1 phosphoadenylyl-sulfate reductase [Demequina sp. SYSU T00039]MDN4489952.1 phosphoadenylyl-sulfate reductase [Demequina sp. SYSU T00068]
MNAPPLGASSLTLLNPSEWNAETCAQVNERLLSASAAHIADWAAATFGRRLAVAASMQDTILPHLFGTRIPGVDVLFLETGYHFPETLATRDAAAAALDITVVDVTPKQTVAEQDAAYGKDLFARDPGLCCQLRKMDPLRDALAGYDAWVTGARRVDAVTRSELPVVSWDAKHGLVKINPLALWDDAAVESYQDTHGLPRNPLVAQGYPSIGCLPCTQRVAPGADPRSGRWAGLDKTECGIHVG